ncbi:hypothetical protein H7827_13840 [Streptomyces sp. JH002]|uniref:hypothetical protein n=1 Tax=Streptomyces sp. JH002 TaxID=2763259 RepID=UPI003D807C81
MSFFGRKKNEPPATNSEMVELGREFAIARRHRDRKTVNRITRQLGADSANLTDTDRSSFEAGQRSYDEVPAIPRPRRNRRR